MDRKHQRFGTCVVELQNARLYGTVLPDAIDHYLAAVERYIIGDSGRSRYAFGDAWIYRKARDKNSSSATTEPNNWHP
jgi:hypothetical protein